MTNPQITLFIAEWTRLNGAPPERWQTIAARVLLRSVSIRQAIYELSNQPPNTLKDYHHGQTNP